jgi:Tfp pilus assembly ATPase PilU
MLNLIGELKMDTIFDNLRNEALTRLIKLEPKNARQDMCLENEALELAGKVTVVFFDELLKSKKLET